MHKHNIYFSIQKKNKIKWKARTNGQFQWHIQKNKKLSYVGVCSFLFIIFVDDRRHPSRLSLFRRAVFFNTTTANHTTRINYSKSIVDPQRQQMAHGWVRSPHFSPTRGTMLRWSAKSGVIMSGDVAYHHFSM